MMVAGWRGAAAREREGDMAAGLVGGRGDFDDNGVKGGKLSEKGRRRV